MDLYTETSYGASKLLTERYSTSFSASCRLLDSSIRNDIYAIYGLVRLADEVVDTYRGDDSLEILNDIEAELQSSLSRRYSSNPVIHAFASTAKRCDIGDDLTRPFFDSMRLDIGGNYQTSQYKEYIYGSAEVVGLMSLRVFVSGDKQRFHQLEPGAKALGSAYQKVNFLRDLKADYEELGRVYFPGISYESFSETDFQAIIDDIEADFTVADNYVDQLPDNSRKAVRLSYSYYRKLLEALRQAGPEELQKRRVRVPDWQKIILFSKAGIGR